MTDLFRIIILMGLSPLIVMAIQCILFRLPMLQGKGPQLITMVAMVIGYAIFFSVAGTFEFNASPGIELNLYLFGLYSFCAYTYFHIFNMSETSRRIRMLFQIAASNLDQSQSIEGIYDANEMIKARLDRLVDLGQVELKNGAYFPKRQMITRTAAVLYGLSRLLGMPWEPIVRYRSGK